MTEHTRSTPKDCKTLACWVETDSMTSETTSKATYAEECARPCTRLGRSQQGRTDLRELASIAAVGTTSAKLPTTIDAAMHMSTADWYWERKVDIMCAAMNTCTAAAPWKACMIFLCASHVMRTS